MRQIARILENHYQFIHSVCRHNLTYSYTLRNTEQEKCVGTDKSKGLYQFITIIFSKHDKLLK
jgi:hypothetical protein